MKEEETMGRENREKRESKIGQRLIWKGMNVIKSLVRGFSRIFLSPLAAGNFHSTKVIQNVNFQGT